MKTHPLRQRLVNLALFLFFFDVALHQVAARVLGCPGSLLDWYAARGGVLQGVPSWYDLYTTTRWLGDAAWLRMSVADWTFAAQSLLMAGMLLLRRRHLAVDPSPWRQAVALAAFGSGVLMIGAAPTATGALALGSEAVVLAANALAVATLLNLGRSFGILIALRRVETRGLYGLVRHPMYASDMLMRLGYLMAHLTPATTALIVASIAAYVTRAVLEERFLSRDPAYADYRERVRFRFVPGLF